MNFLSRLFGKSETSTEILCPHCERSMHAGHDVEACARKRMSRRHFFGVLGGAAAALAIAPRVPTGGLFDPIADIAGQYRSGNMLLTPQMIADETRRILVNNLGPIFEVQSVYNRHLSTIGETLTIRPPRLFKAPRLSRA